MPTFQPGYAAALYVAGYNLGQYFASYDQDRGVMMLENTTFGSAGWKTRQPGLGDGSAKASGYWDGSVGAVDDAFAAVLAASAAAAFTVAPLGDTAGNLAYLGAVREAKYGTKLSVGALVACEAEWVLQGGAYAPLVQGVMHRALSAIAATAFGTSQDGGAATTTGWRATLHCTLRSGSSPTLDAKLQDSADNVTYADVTGGAFTQLTASGGQILYSAAGATLRRYARLAYTLGGGTPSFTIAAAVARG